MCILCKKNHGERKGSPNLENGAVLALTLIIGAAAALVGLALMQYALAEMRTAQEFAAAQDLFYVAEAGIENGMAVLQGDPHRREPISAYADPARPGQGSFQVIFLRQDSSYDGYLPRGYSSLSQLTDEQVLIRSRGIIKKKKQERTFDLWVLAEREPLYTKALFARDMLHLKGVSPEEGGGPGTAGIHGNVHIDRRLHLEHADWTDVILFRKASPTQAAGPSLSYSSGVTIPRRVNWDTGEGEVHVHVEADGPAQGNIFLPGGGSGGEGAYYRVYSPPTSYRRHIPESVGFGPVPRLDFPCEDFKKSFLEKMEASSGGGMDPIIERPGGEVWNNDNIHFYNGKVTHVDGDLTIENTIGSDGCPVNPLSFDGVIFVDGLLTLRHYRAAGIPEGSEQLVGGIIHAREIRCLHDAEIPPDAGDTFLEIRGLCIAEDIFSMASAPRGEGGAVDYRKVHGTVVAGEIFLQGPHTAVCQGDLHELIPDYRSCLPPDRYVVRQWFKPYLMED